MRVTRVIVGFILTGICGLAAVSTAAPDPKLPPGPILDRHELMEGIAKNATIIGDSMRSGDFDPVGPAAEKIQSAAAKITPLFPPGSTHENSRAKPEIWTDWPKFHAGAQLLESTAAALADAATHRGNVPVAVIAMGNACKSCHERFRLPEKAKPS